MLYYSVWLHFRKTNEFIQTTNDIKILFFTYKAKATNVVLESKAKAKAILLKAKAKARQSQGQGQGHKFCP